MYCVNLSLVPKKSAVLSLHSRREKKAEPERYSDYVLTKAQFHNHLPFTVYPYTIENGRELWNGMYICIS